MTTNKLQSLVILLSLSSVNFMMGMNQDALQTESTTLSTTNKIGWEEGKAQAAPVGYLTAEILQGHPIFQKMKKAFQTAEEKYDITIETVLQLSLAEQKEFLNEMQKDPANSEASQLLSSMINASEEKQNEETITAGANGTEITEAPTQLSWYLSWLKVVYGSSETMQYALGSNEFDQNNSAHKALFKEAKEEHTAANTMLNSFYTERFTAVKQAQCITIAALLKTVETTLSSWQTQLEQMTKNHETQKNNLLAQHEVAFKKNNAALETILTATPNSSLTLKVSSELELALTDLYDMEEHRTNAISWIKDNQAKVAQYAPLFAIEDKK